MTSTIAYADESIRGNTYLMACVTISGQHGEIRRRLRTMARELNKASLHFHQLLPRQRQATLKGFDQLAATTAVVFRRRRPAGESELNARDRILSVMTRHLQHQGASELCLDALDGRELQDGKTIRDARTGGPNFTYRHSPSRDEPLLWLPDGIAHTVGRGDNTEHLPSWYDTAIDLR